VTCEKIGPWVFGSFAVVLLGLIVAGMIAGIIEEEQRRARLKAFMRECIAVESEDRCLALWKWKAGQ
jgi:hypothetical protein